MLTTNRWTLINIHVLEIKKLITKICDTYFRKYDFIKCWTETCRLVRAENSQKNYQWLKKNEQKIIFNKNSANAFKVFMKIKIKNVLFNK